jgi:hypothetical protein
MRTLFLKAGARPNSGPTHSHYHRGAAWTVASVLIVASATAASAETLTWKLKPGQVLHYVMEQKSVMTASTNAGRQNKSTRSQTMNFTWTVLSVSPDGVANISQHVDRIRMRAEVPPFMPFEFDSQGAKVDPPAPFEVEQKLLSAMAGSEFSFNFPKPRSSRSRAPSQPIPRAPHPTSPSRPSRNSFSNRLRPPSPQPISSQALPGPVKPPNSRARSERSYSTKFSPSSVPTPRTPACS